jgi:hypothetical protein
MAHWGSGVIKMINILQNYIFDIMIPWYGGQEQKFISVGLQVQFTLWGELY